MGCRAGNSEDNTVAQKRLTQIFVLYGQAGADNGSRFVTSRDYFSCPKLHLVSVAFVCPGWRHNLRESEVWQTTSHNEQTKKEPVLLIQ